MVDKFTYRIEWSEEDNAYVGRCLEFPSLSSQEKKPEDALKEIRKAVLAAVRWMKEEGEMLPEPLGTQKYKGRIVLRVSPAIHKELVLSSREAGVSLNQFLLSRVAIPIKKSAPAGKKGIG